MIRTISQAKEALVPVFESYGVRKAVIFGSIAKGTASESSDLDLLVDSGLHGLDFVGLIEDIRRVAGVPVDVVDITHIEKDHVIYREIMKNGVVIYVKESKKGSKVACRAIRNDEGK